MEITRQCPLRTWSDSITRPWLQLSFLILPRKLRYMVRVYCFPILSTSKEPYVMWTPLYFTRASLMAIEVTFYLYSLYFSDMASTSSFERKMKTTRIFFFG